MPELPEVETTRLGITPHIVGRRVSAVEIRQPRLRWPVPRDLRQHIQGRTLETIERRGKYLLFRFKSGTLLLHLGMSGSLRVVDCNAQSGKHDHLDLAFGRVCLRFRDPRRFGAVLWTSRPYEAHPLLRDLGPEPLGGDFTADYLYDRARHRRIPVKSLIMDSHVVVGVGNIYASESLFLAGIHPRRRSDRISRSRYAALVEAIRTTLASAIRQGGTTLRDFQQADGQPGYFARALLVYGRADEPCPHCGRGIKVSRIGQRSSFYCPGCQR